MTSPPTWDQLHRVAEMFHVLVKINRTRLHSSVELISTLGLSAGEVLASMTLGALDAEDAERVMRGMVGAALVQLGPGAPVGAAVLERATAELGLTAAEAGELAHLAELLEGGHEH